MGNNWMVFIVASAAIGILSFVLGYLVRQARTAAKAESVEAKAERLLAEALDGRSSTLGDDHPDTLQTLNDLGVLRREQERYVLVRNSTGIFRPSFE